MSPKNENVSAATGITAETENPSYPLVIDSFILHDDCTLDFRKSQETDDSILLDYLGIGAKNALTAAQLAKMLGTRKRAISLEVERLRRKGFPICASGANGSAGYFLAADTLELAEYCISLAARLKNIRATLAAVEATCSRLSRSEG
ncbi:MAG: hypothetical protein LUE06_09955 [Oscillospiraceae bacterium]|nr:hypothetical protein [Oscillospiraceae bacterium]